MFEVERFIDLVQQRPLIWNKEVRQCRQLDVTTRDLAWIEVGEGMYNNWAQLPLVDREAKIKIMKSKWRHLRDNYLKSLKGRNQKKYIYSDRLEFLLETFGGKITLYNEHASGNKNKIENDESSSCSDALMDLSSKSENDKTDTYTNGHIDSGSKITDNCYESCSSDTVEDTYQLKDTRPSISPTKKCQKTKLPTLRPKLPTLRPKVPTLEPKLPTAKHVEASPIQEDDVDLMFFNSLLPDYKELDEEEKLDFRIKCLQFIRDARKSRKS